MSTLGTKTRLVIGIPFGLLLGTLLLGCTVGPKYVPPTVQAPAAYKELSPGEMVGGVRWGAANPADALTRGRWWESFTDQELNTLETEVVISNQNIAAAAANYATARAIVREVRSQYFPSLTAGASIGYSRSSVFPAANLTSGTTYAEYSLPVEASWEPDLWGRVRNSVHSAVFAAQADAATLANVRLTVQAQLAMDYYFVRTQDLLAKLLDDTVASDRQTLDLTQTLYRSGLTTDEAVSAAEAQLRSVQVQRESVRIARAQYEHAVAVLLGKAPADFSLSPAVAELIPPAVPVGVPSELLERRPDIAAAERTLAQANAQVGVAKSAYFPNVTLSGTAGFTGLSASDWFTWPSRIWALGPAITETIFDAGLRRATVQQYRSQYDAAIASYRQTTLTAFQQVEDSLVASHVLAGELEQQNQAIAAAQRAFDEATVRYRAGLDPYLNVIQAQQTLLNYQETAVQIRAQQMTAAVQLIQALGGGWKVQQLPTGAMVAKTK
ncbi:MAG TPA: efflux transporter outer membrane subunit [Acidobacteriaceae bacterium]|nr:efflux transporter outer membrane subunit [Acidobacteriaceae bacterium]